MKKPGQGAWIVVVLLAWQAGAVVAQPAKTPEPAGGMVELNLPEEVELKLLVDYVGKRQGINFIYDEQLTAKRVSIKVSQKIPADSLLTLLESALKMKGLSLSRTQVPGMMKIELARQLSSMSVGPQVAAEDASKRPSMAVTRVFELKNSSAQRVEQVLAPFLSGATASVTSLPDLRLAIVTDYADNMKKLEEMVALVDRPGREVVVRFVPVTHLEAEPAAQKVSQFLAAKGKASGPSATQGASGAAAGSVSVIGEDRTNQIAVMGHADEIGEAVALIQSLDVPLGLQTRVYTLAVASPEQIDRIVRKLVGEQAVKRLYKSATESDANLLIATTTPEIHAQIESLRTSLDKPKEDAQSPVRFYKLENAKAADVLSTLVSIEGDSGLGDVSIDGLSADREREPRLAIKGPGEADANPATSPRNGDQTLPPLLPPYAPRESGFSALGGPLRKSTLHLRDARVIADEPTNTVIVVAKPSVHPIYEKLIKRLDIRRPQVLVEATVVAIDTSNDFALGVEIYSSEKVNGGKLLNFTKFGLTTKDSLPGNLTLSPGIGFTGALLKADIAEFVIKALEGDSRARVISRPSVLINDNAIGSLISEAEEPFESVNASSTVATTSFAGFASAGTNIRITPQISEGDHLKLKYEITLSSFTEESTSATLPPSRQTNSLKSEATIPDGHTIVVGGLTRENFSESIDRVPILGRVPVLEYLLSSRTNTNSRTTLFVFIRAVILRDDKFKDLKVLSGAARNTAGIPSDFPTSEPKETR